MRYSTQKFCLLTVTGFILSCQAALAPVAHSDIFQWEYVDPADTTKGKRESTLLVPDGAGRNALPAANLQKLNLNKAYLVNRNLANAIFYFANVSQADFTGADLTNANLSYANLFSANFTDAIVVGANFATQTGGVTAAQIYSTASYKNKDITGISLYGNDLTGWDLNDLVIRNVEFREAKGLMSGQIYSTASYKNRDLRGVKFESLDVSDWNFANQNLEGASFNLSKLTDTSFFNANVRGSSFFAQNYDSLTSAQLYSTASYQNRDLSGIGFVNANMRGWDLSRQNLTSAFMDSCELDGANLENSNLEYAVFDFTSVQGTNFKNANIRGASFWFARGFTPEQLYETTSYQARDLGPLGMFGNDLRGWDFASQDMAESEFREANLDDVRFERANLSNSNFSEASLRNADLTTADLRGSAGANLSQALVSNLIRPDGTIAGLSLTTGEELVVRDHDGSTYSDVASGPIAIRVHEHFSVFEQASLRLIFDDDPWDSVISFEQGVPVQFDGELKLEFAPGTDVRNQIGRSFQVFDWSGVDAASGLNVSTQYRWDLSKLRTAGTITLLAVPEPNTAWLFLSAILSLRLIRVKPH
jgi:uncharacterized protein YjbI with pentapeptide repeats